MRELKKDELLEITGGASIFTAAFMNAAARMASTLIDLGRSLGSAVVRAINGRYCTVSR